MPGVTTASARASTSRVLSNWCTAPRGMHSASPGPTSIGRAVDRPGQHSLEPVDRLLVAVVAVPRRDAHACRNVELEDRDRPSRPLALDQEPDRQWPDRDLFARGCCHRLLLRISWSSDLTIQTIGQSVKLLYERQQKRDLLASSRRA